MSLEKVPFLITGLITAYVVQTPPQAAVPTEQRDKEVGTLDNILAKTVPYNVPAIKTWASVPLLVEAAVIIANRFPSHDISQWILRVFTDNDPSLVQRIVLSPPFLAACIAGAAAGAVRYQCYRTLGKFFTYELKVHDGQKVVTEGPYRYVRHPSYTGYIFGTIGVGLMPLMRGSWLRESGVLREPWARVPWTIGVLWVGYIVAALTLRTIPEDKMMRKKFGQEWDAYVQRVRYRLIPYIF
ncbi:hypothetical protein FOMPIDRAFT_1116918 [Fomitopsis schrenkii]|uniref:Protein-S-isoprenylcysteine O-methyltransferase n=1 Tax=Fomitopsis schrenkii TaxID=2126942 RepID=S8FNW4_FOMSC|nr:hypothetical protein FOMPIDRAFT_1116918 [Fomitopsis schrenkii]